MRLPKNGKVKPLSQMSTFLQTLINSMRMQFTVLVIRENSNPYFHLTPTSTWTSTDWNFSSLWIWPLIKAPFRPFGKKLLTKMPKNVIHRNNWIKCTHLISTNFDKGRPCKLHTTSFTSYSNSMSRSLVIDSSLEIMLKLQLFF